MFRSRDHEVEDAARCFAKLNEFVALCDAALKAADEAGHCLSYRGDVDYLPLEEMAAQASIEARRIDEHLQAMDDAA